MSRVRFQSSLVLAALCGMGSIAEGQGNPLSPVRERGQSVTPVFEGWYKNADGSYSLSFGYMNRNEAEVVDIPLGPANFVSPGEWDGAQPTAFHPRRHWGVFAVRVPADFGKKRVRWTLVVRGDSISIPGSLATQWEIDALQGEAGSGNTPPQLRFVASGPSGSGPGGVYAEPRTVAVNVPLSIDVWATDDGTARPTAGGAGRAGIPVTLTWFKHQGTGAVTFGAISPKVDGAGKASTTATFAEAGSYILRVRANDASGVASAGHAQCCWSNAFVKVTVTR